MNPVKGRQDQIQNGQLIAILFAQIDKIFENFVRPDEFLPTPMNIFFSILYTCIYYNPMNPVKFCQDQWPICRYFCWLKLTKYLKKLSVWINISNTNEYWLPILYTCIN